MGSTLAGVLRFTGDPAGEACCQQWCLGAHPLMETPGEGRSPLLHPRFADEGPPNGWWQRAALGCRAAVLARRSHLAEHRGRRYNSSTRQKD